MMDTTQFFDFVSILVTAGALAIVLTLMVYITFAISGVPQLTHASPSVPSLLHHRALPAQASE
jgi:hypothetical protein